LKLIISFVFAFWVVAVVAQNTPASLHYGLSRFLSELESSHSIDNYSKSEFLFTRTSVYTLLSDAEMNMRNLSLRQKKELGYYLREFHLAENDNRWQEYDVDLLRRGTGSLSINPPGFFTKSGDVSFTITPLLGAQYILSSNQHIIDRHVGVRAEFATGVFGSYVEYRRNGSDSLAFREYFGTHTNAAPFGYYYPHAFKAGLVVSNQWITTSLSFDNHPFLPQINHSSVLGQHTPSFPSFRITYRPFSFVAYSFNTGVVSQPFQWVNEPENYIHKKGDLTSFAVNQLIFKPFRQTEIAIGQAAFKKSNNYAIAYALPVNLYISDNPNENSLFFYYLKFAAIRHLTLEFLHLFDDFSFERAQSEYDRNVFAIDFKATVANWPIENVIFNYSFTRNSPLLYNHPATPLYNLWPEISTLPLDNRRTHTFELVLKPTHNLDLTLKYMNLNVGESQTYQTTYPYQFDLLADKIRTTDAWSIEMAIKPAYNTRLFANLDYFFHNGSDPAYLNAGYNPEIEYFFRLGIAVGL
jgi:hypothetical protein